MQIVSLTVVAYLDTGANIRDLSQGAQMLKTRETERMRENAPRSGPSPTYGSAALNPVVIYQTIFRSILVSVRELINLIIRWHLTLHIRASSVPNTI